MDFPATRLSAVTAWRGTGEVQTASEYRRGTGEVLARYRRATGEVQARYWRGTARYNAKRPRKRKQDSVTNVTGTQIGPEVGLYFAVSVQGVTFTHAG